MKATEATEGYRLVAEQWAAMAQTSVIMGNWSWANHCASQATRVWRKVRWEEQ